MAKATISRQLDSVQVIGAATTTAPGLTQRDQGLPSGDQAVRSLMLSYETTLSGSLGSAPTKVTNGNRILLNALTVETDKHGKLADNLDGLMAWNMNQYEYGTAGVETQASSTPANTDTPAATYRVPFSLFHGVRPYDTHVDMKKARMKVSTQYGSYLNVYLGGGGSPTGITTLQQTIEAKLLPGPLVEKDGDQGPQSLSELPVYIRCLEQNQQVITATQNRFQVNLPFGDRIWRRLYISQRNTSDRTEMSNVIASTAAVSLYLNNVPIVDRRRFVDITRDNKHTYSIESLPTGVCVIDFDDEQMDRILNYLWSLSLDSGNLQLFVDVTSQSNASLLLGYDSLKPIQPAAQRTSAAA